MAHVIGTDPEVFIVDALTRKAVGAHKFFGHKGYKTEVGKTTRLFRDGYALELNVKPAFHTQHLSKALAVGFAKASDIIGPGHRLVASSTVKVDPHEFLDVPEDLKSFGCDPSYCAYELRVKRPDVDALLHPRRYAGLHLHYSSSPIVAPFIKNPKKMPLAIRILDQFIGLPSSFITASPGVFQRRELYGQAGEFRPQNYPDGTQGLEYRVMGSEILATEGLFEFFSKAFLNILANFPKYESIWDSPSHKSLGENIRKAINTGEGLVDYLPSIPGIYSQGMLVQYRDAYQKTIAVTKGAPFGSQ